MTCVERLAEIEARAEEFRVMDEGPGVPTEVWGITSSGSARDVPWLVEQVRIRDAAIAAVLDLAEGWIFKGSGHPDDMPDEVDYFYDGVATNIRDAIASALDVTL